MTSEVFNELAISIPHKPGIYKYFDSNKKLIYVGKAKDLNKRVRSYFLKTKSSYKTFELVNQINSIEFTIVKTEQDALLLENALIKEYKPRYNINLKDDKSYPYIIVKNEPFPRIFLTRRKINDGSLYLGPFTSAGKVREMITFIRRFIPLRTCKLTLTQKNITAGKFKVCLEYHLGNCKAPCVALQTAEDYGSGIEQIKQLLKGNLNPIIDEHKKQMQVHAAMLHFEKAEAERKKIEYLEAYQVKSAIVNRHISNVDVFFLVKEEQRCFIAYLMVQNGTIIQTHTAEMETRLEETVPEVLQFAVETLRLDFSSTANEVIVQENIEMPEGISVTVPKAGEKKKILELAEQNAQFKKQDWLRQKALYLKADETSVRDTLEQLKTALHLPVVPVHIECFDNSNLQGSHPVSAMVCFINGQPSKKDYRHFNVKNIAGINDFATMKDTVHRRYKRVTDESQPLPNLVIIDGGKGQLSAAMESINDLGLAGILTVVGLAKREEELFFPGDQESVKLDWNSPGLQLIRRIRDEVHRFGIKHHRNRRSKNQLKESLTEITGIGAKTSDSLLRHFKSVRRIREADQKEIAEIVGQKKAGIVYSYFRK